MIQSSWCNIDKNRAREREIPSLSVYWTSHNSWKVKLFNFFSSVTNEWNQKKWVSLNGHSYISLRRNYYWNWGLEEKCNIIRGWVLIKFHGLLISLFKSLQFWKTNSFWVTLKMRSCLFLKQTFHGSYFTWTGYERS